MGSHHKKKKGTDDSRIIIADIKKDAEADAIRTVLQTGLEMTSPGVPRVPEARAIIDFVNVTETIDAAQTGGGGGGPPDTIPPAQVTGLTATAINDTQINLGWTANSEPDLNYYDVYRSTISGFTVTLGVTVPIASPSSNSYSNTGLTASTTYYYKVGAVDNSVNRGPVSVQASATTLPPGTLIPSLELRFEGNLTDTSPNNLNCQMRNFAAPVNGFSTGQFGQGCLFNTPINGSPKGTLRVDRDPAIQMDITTGFSFSCWINPLAITAAPGFRRQIVGYSEMTGDFWAIEIDPTGLLYFFVTKAGITYKREISGVTLSTWQHVAATFNGATNTVALYRNAVAGVSSTAALSSGTMDTSPPLNPDMFIGAKWDPDASTYFQGTMDEIRYYKGVVLTPTQVTNLKNTNAP